jgi:hypothetical protein
MSVAMMIPGPANVGQRKRVMIVSALRCFLLWVAVAEAGCYSNIYVNDVPPVTENGSATASDGDGDTATESDVDRDTALWRPEASARWQWQMQGELNLDVDADLFVVDLFGTSSDTIDRVHNTGRSVVCCFSVGVREQWTDDAEDFAEETIGNSVQAAQGERWLDITAPTVRDIMIQRIVLAGDKGCDGVAPDYMDSYLNDTGFDLSADDQIEYNRFLADAARERGLSVGLTNDIEQTETLEPYFDWVINESCLEWDECHLLTPFLSAQKAVFHVAYTPSAREGPSIQSQVCGDTAIAGFSTIIKNRELDDWVLFCE